MDNLFVLIPLIFLLGLLSGLIWFLKARYANHRLFSQLNKSRITFLLLISWTVLGFFTTLDYTQQWGCILFHESIFSKENIIYSGTAIGLLSLGFFNSKRQVGTVILLVELLFWLYKLFLVKGGYAIGIGGEPSIQVLLFDTIALTLRLLLIKQVRLLAVKPIIVLVCVFVVLAVKVQFFR